MQPTRAVLNGNDKVMVGSGYFDPRVNQAPNLPPANPALGDAMRNRNWTGHEAQQYYEMRQAPLPYQFTRGNPHPRFGGGSGTPMTQWMPPEGPPAGFEATRQPVVYSAPGVQPGMTRPSYAYNRVVGAPGRQPLMYVTTWPSQGYPAGSNTYIPSWEATGLLIKYTRNPSFFRVNKYVKDIKVPKDQGYYLTLDGDSPYRILNVDDFLWEDSADAPGGRDQKQGFGYLPYRTARYCFPFSLGRKSVEQAEWPILAEHAQMQAAKAMTLRTMLNYTLATTTANWTGSWGTNYSGATATWSNAASNTTNAIQTDINTAMIAIEQASGGIVTDEEALHITINPTLARGVAKSYEYKQYIQGSPDALAAITDQRNPSRKYGLAPFLYGLALVVENAIVVTTPKSAQQATQVAQSRNYVWGTGNVVLSSKPQGITAEDEQTLDFSTFCFRFYEMMTTEQKSDPDNRREIGRVVEDYVVNLQAPQTGYLLTGAA